jgi:hypothetical protein
MVWIAYSENTLPTRPSYLAQAITPPLDWCNSSSVSGLLCNARAMLVWPPPVSNDWRVREKRENYYNSFLKPYNYVIILNKNCKDSSYVSKYIRSLG